MGFVVEKNERRDSITTRGTKKNLGVIFIRERSIWAHPHKKKERPTHNQPQLNGQKRIGEKARMHAWWARKKKKKRDDPSLWRVGLGFTGLVLIEKGQTGRGSQHKQRDNRKGRAEDPNGPSARRNTTGLNIVVCTIYNREKERKWKGRENESVCLRILKKTKRGLTIHPLHHTTKKKRLRTQQELRAKTTHQQ